MTALAIFRIARPFLPWIAGAFALVGAFLWVDNRGYQRGFHKRDPEVAALNLTIANVKAASAQSAADNLAHVRATETRNVAIQKEAENAIDQAGADARSAVADYVRLHPAPAGHLSYAGTGGISVAPTAAGTPVATSPQTVVPASDLTACAEAYVTATGWQAWWGSVSAVPR